MKIRDKYNKINKPLKATIWFAVGNLAQKGIAFLLIPFFTRLMPPDQYGEYSVFQAWYSILGVVVTLSLGKNVFTKGLVQFEGDKDRFTAAMTGLGMLSTAVFYAVYILSPDFWNSLTGLSTELTSLMFIELFLMSGFECWCALKRYDYEYVGVVALSLGIAILTALISIPAVLFTHSNAAEYQGTAAIISKVLASCLFYLIPLVLIVKKDHHFIDAKYWKFALSFNLPIIVHLLSSLLLQNSDRIMISQLCGNYEAGTYSLAYSIAMILQIVTVSVNLSLTPWTFKALKSGKGEQVRNIATSYLLLLAGCVLFLICFSPEILTVVASDEYAEAVYIMPPVTASIVFIAAQSLFLNVEYFYSKTKLIMVASLVASVVNIALNAVCLPVFGYLAAGYTTLLCYGLLCVAHFCVYWSICKKEKIARTYNDTQLFAILLVTVTVSLIMIPLYSCALLRYAALFLLVIVVILLRKRIVQAIKLLLTR